MHEIRIPRLGWSMEEGIFIGWLKQHGDAVAVGDPLFELEGEKAQQDIESVDAGTLHIPPDSPQPGTVIPVGALLGYLLAPGESVPSGKPTPPLAPESVDPPAGASAPSEAPPASPSVRRLSRALGVSLEDVAGTGRSGRITTDDVTQWASSQQSTSGTRRTDSPTALRRPTGAPVASMRAKRVASELGIDWRALPGTGRDGRIRESDVRAAQASQASSRLPSLPAGPVGMPARRRAIADRLRTSRDRTVPVTLSSTADATNLIALREQFKSARARIVPAYTDIMACLVATVLARHPHMAVRWNPVDQSLLRIAADQFNIGIAVDAADGLIVPIVRDVLGKSLLGVAQQTKALVDRARSGRLAAAEMQEGVFTITNLGALGIDAFTPIINYPEIAILGLGALRREAVVLADDRIVARDRMTLSLTFDHAAIDGAPAATFLRDIVSAVENPAAHLLNT